MYTLQDAEYLRDYYADKILGRKNSTGYNFVKIEIECIASKFEVWCQLSSYVYHSLSKTAKELGLVSPLKTLNAR